MWFIYIFYSSLMSKSSSQEIVQRVGILQQLLTDIFHPNRYEIPDLHQKSSSLFSAGFKYVKVQNIILISYFKHLFKKFLKNFKD